MSVPVTAARNGETSVRHNYKGNERNAKMARAISARLSSVAYVCGILG